jgi:hypothetical protein
MYNSHSMNYMSYTMDYSVYIYYLNQNNKTMHILHRHYSVESYNSIQPALYQLYIIP